MANKHGDLPDMPVPDFAYTNRSENQVYIRELDYDGQEHRRIIGELTDSTAKKMRMIPNLLFREIYPDLWLEYYPDKPLPVRIDKTGKVGRRAGQKDKNPRKPRSDKGKKRGPYKKRSPKGEIGTEQ